MHDMLADTTSNNLLAALNSNMVAYWSAYGRAMGCTVHATASVVWFYTGLQVPLFNGVLSAQLNHAEVRTTFASLQSKITEQSAPALWWIGPQSKPDNIGSLLEQLGAQRAGEVPGMAIELAELGHLREQQRCRACTDSGNRGEFLRFSTKSFLLRN